MPFSSDGSSLTSRLNVAKLAKGTSFPSLSQRSSPWSLLPSRTRNAFLPRTTPGRTRPHPGSGPWPLAPETRSPLGTCPKLKSTKPSRGTHVPQPRVREAPQSQPLFWSFRTHPCAGRGNSSPSHTNPSHATCGKTSRTHPTPPLYRPQGPHCEVPFNTSARCVAVLLLDPTSPVQPTPPSPETELHTQVAWRSASSHAWTAGCAASRLPGFPSRSALAQAWAARDIFFVPRHFPWALDLFSGLGDLRHRLVPRRSPMKHVPANAHDVRPRLSSCAT